VEYWSIGLNRITPLLRAKTGSVYPASAGLDRFAVILVERNVIGGSLVVVVYFR
jgi:hypothetical protein